MVMERRIGVGLAQFFRKEVGDRLIDAGQVAAVDGDADEDRDQRLRGRLEVGLRPTAWRR